MTRDLARRWVIMTSLVLSSLLLVIFIAAPVVGMHFSGPQAQNLLQITLPPFFGYLGAAVRALTKIRGPIKNDIDIQLHPLFPLLLKGPVYIFILVVIVAIVAYEYSNGPAARPGSGMTPDQLSWLISIALALLSLTTHWLVAYLFEEEVDSPKIVPESPSMET